jgi:hypothetical protein
MILDKLPLSLIAPFAIPDDPAIFEEKPPPRDVMLFNVDKEKDDEDGDG